MKLHYYWETDSLYIDLNSRPSADSRQMAEGLVIDFDAEGNVVGIDIDHASQKLDLKTLEAVALPPDTRHLRPGTRACFSSAPGVYPSRSFPADSPASVGIANRRGMPNVWGEM